MPVLNLVIEADIAGLFRLESSLPEDESVSDPRLASMDEVALVLHTSGTTSRPKIVPLTRRNIHYSLQNITASYSLTPADRCLNMMPLFHIHGLMAALSASLTVGASVICTPGFVPDQVVDWLSGFSPTWYTAVPTIHQAFLETVRRRADLCYPASLRFIRSCSSSLPPQVARDLEEVFKVPVLEAYGMTEATHQIASNPLPPGKRKFGSVGLPTGTTQVAILDPSGRRLPVNTPGEISIRGENVMAGYENNPEANGKSFSDGWLRTGDQGIIDEDGYVFIQGRLKELINRGGEKITPREIEEVLLRHPAIRQAVAFSMPHPTLGEDVGAAVVLQDGQSLSARNLRQFAAASLADFKVPRLIVFLNEIPKGATGKIQRIGLADKLQAELDAARSLETSGLIPARTPIEAEILSIWQDVLGVERIGVEDDFLALGGESIQAGRILLLLNERYSLDLQLSDVFQASTVAAMAALVQEKGESA